ncbi:TldD/PmbA family protein [Actinophytocola glycyrrhizae]|uniref:TldD/PmbA family protein n=1 Tax=Actinophytocola glycyrrhizae TaxID=2044873 RepID=A0ABV9RU97_9PSEU
MMPHIDPEFATLPLHDLADAALSEARESGAQHADFRVARTRGQRLRLADTRLQSLTDTVDVGLAVRVVVDGTWGFAGTVDLTPEAARATARKAVEIAEVAAAMNTERIDLAPEPAHGNVTWVSAYDIDPFTIPAKDKIDLLEGWSADLLAQSVVSHVNASLYQVKECTFYSDGATSATQQRVRLFPQLTAVAVTATGFDDLSTLAPPVGRGWEYLTGTGWDFPGELAGLPELLAERVQAPSVAAGRYDLVIDPTNLWLTIHESVGHATELDRAFGYEAAYAGTSFAMPDRLGSLRYGSKLMQVTADRTVEHGLATVGWDDEGVAAQSWDLVVDGVFAGYQLDRRMARLGGFGRSTGCAFADSPGHMPLERMPNVSLRPAPDGPDIAGLVAGVEDGIYVVGDRSWSIDMQRYNFQFTGQRFHRIRHGRLAGQVKDVAYQATTTDFWNSLQALGGPQTYLLAGEFNCGKGQPGQVAPVSHGTPAACFAGVRVLNTAWEGQD